MRSIMDIARSEGEDIYSLETQLSCLQVFALGGNTKDDNGLETSYYSTRLGLSIALKGAGNFISKEGIQGISKILMTSTHPMVKLIAIIASRFTVQVSEKFDNLLQFHYLKSKHNVLFFQLLKVWFVQEHLLK